VKTGSKSRITVNDKANITRKNIDVSKSSGMASDSANVKAARHPAIQIYAQGRFMFKYASFLFTQKNLAANPATVAQAAP
jgi:hypothetical protein